ncbi:MAG TPA: hypothetical protein VGS61_06595 [Acidimicrobiales bacterium]|nr:hypothetical protein [Acidimicrobiales bacterium]
MSTTHAPAESPVPRDARSSAQRRSWRPGPMGRSSAGASENTYSWSGSRRGRSGVGRPSGGSAPSRRRNPRLGM